MRFYLFFLMLLTQGLAPLYGAELSQETAEYYKGVINGKYEFMMQLTNYKNKCSGNYYYKNNNRPISLFGKCDLHTIILNEPNISLKKVKARSNQFIGIKRNDKIEGEWKSADGSAIYKFYATKITPSKLEILGDAIGQYDLSNVSGAYGANSLLDIYKDNGKWQASGSSISGGTREGYNLVLTKKDLKILSTLKMVVDDKLTISIVLDGKVIANFPYAEKSFFSIKSFSREEDTISRIFAYENYPNFDAERLHIAATDEFNFHNYISSENTPIDSKNALIIDYYFGSFLVSIFNANCCDGVTLNFTKH